MYLIYVDADDDKIVENGMSPEEFWETLKVNFEDVGFMLLDGTHQWFVNWDENKTLGHVWAIQSAWANDLPECVRSMKEYTVYEAGYIEDPIVTEEDVDRFAYLKSRKEFSDDDIAIERNSNYLNNMIKELGLIEKHGKRKSKPVNLRGRITVAK